MMSARLLCCGLTVLALTIGVFSTANAAEDELWTTSFEEAKATAAEEGKDIFMEFTGSDWCPPCKMLHANVLTKDVFKTEMPKEFVLLKLDSPRDKSKQTDEEIEQYKRLSSKFNVTGVPTIILADAEGRPYARQSGYNRTKSAEEYVQTWTKDTEIREKRDEFFAQAESAEGVEKAKLLDKGLSALEPEMKMAVYGETVKKIIELDAENTAGLKEKYEQEFKTASVEKEMEQIQQSFDQENPGATLTKIQSLIEKEDLKGQTLQKALYLKAMVQYQMKDVDASKKTLEAALKLDPDSQHGKQIERLLQNVFNEKDKDKDKEE